MFMIRYDTHADLNAKHKAMAFQVEAFDAIKDLPYGAIFHEQGLGKTKIAIDLILYWLSKHIADSVVVVTKRALTENWKRELRTHTNVRPRLLSQNRNENFAALNSPTRIYICHYEVLVSEKSRLRLFLKTRKVAFVLDESHKIKNPATAITQAAFELSDLMERRVILSGTPIANRPFDLWAQIFFLDKGASLGANFKDFKSGFDLTNELALNVQARERFEYTLGTIFHKINSFSVRETKKGAEIQLPNKRIETIIVDWEPRQKEIYETIRQEFRATVIRDGVPTEDSSEAVMKRLLRLVQAASNPLTIDEGYRNEPGKFLVLTDLLFEIVKKREKAIIWTSFTKNADWLTRKLQMYSAVKIHGQMAMNDRTRSIDVFLSQETCKVLIATPGAAKEGLTLTVANNVIFFDRLFSLDDYLQSQDRIHRISQTKECLVYNLMMEDSVDQWVDSLLNAKHLAAQLGLGDIELSQYRQESSYDFADELKKLLDIQGELEENQ